MQDSDKLYMRGPAARELRAQGHHLQPKVMVGREGSAPAVVAALEAVLAAHELVKVKIQEGCPEDKTTVAQQLAAGSNSRIVQIIGRTILLYRPPPTADHQPKKPRCAAGKAGACRNRPRAGQRGRKPATGAGAKTGKIRSLAKRR
ncbi:ribosome assembly RNA-binding protein YhbY [Desulfurivibrio dismutans]|uniref:ribosome assembly RNA-binding protein YhbY n=1 Tax=Desulfurivibrio dismutans TaxID=1398908 RepID=UPI0023DC8EB2|nr:ribosome assembly RNA-binding protein YhbY [Desulfurivibrio alkaliphilus]MDF1613715.1 ribosome assembly RNA-binding protein YhbY [Desulfurivibrio alkaliphilus]